MGNHIIEIIAAIFLGGALIWAIYYLVKNKTSYNHYLMEFIPNMFPTLGMLGTFGGITYGLIYFNSEDLENSIPDLLQGLTTAFFVSIAGVFLLLIFSFVTNYMRYKNEKDLKSDETLALYDLIKQNKESNDLLVTKLEMINTSIIANTNKSNTKLDNLKTSISTLSETISSKIENLNQSVLQINQIDFEGNQVHLGNILIATFDETKQQTSALQNFSTDLANTIQTGFTQIKEDTSITDTITSSFDKLVNDTRVTEKLDSVKSEITDLGSKLQSPAEDVVKGLSESLSSSMQEILQQVKGSIGEGINSDMSEVAKELKLVSSNLNGFPDKINTMASGLEETFKKLENGLAQTTSETNEKSKEAIESLVTKIDALTSNLKESLEGLTNNVNETSKNTLGLSEESSKAIKEQFEIIAQTVSTQFGNLQVGQNEIVGNQEKNIIATTALVEKLNLNIEQLDNVSHKFNDTLQNISLANNDLKAASNQFQTVSSKIESSSSTLAEAQSRLVDYNNHFITNNKEILSQYVTSLDTSKEFNKDLVAKYNTVHNSFGEVFNAVDAGIKQYSNSMRGSLEDFLNTYNTTLTNGTQTLENAVSVLGDSIETLTEVLPKK